MFNCLLDGYDCGTFIIYGKLEAYHCKRTAQDKKLSKEVEEAIRIKKEQCDSTNHTFRNSSFSSMHSLNNHSNFSSTTNLDDDDDDCFEGGVPIIQSKDYLRNQTAILSPALSPPCPHDLSVPTNPFGDSKSDTQKFIDLISLLNLSYPDYDFSGLKQEDFSIESYKQRLINSINLSLRDALVPDQLNDLWKGIDSIISIQDCEVYSYNPDRNQDDPTGDPLALSNGKVWIWNYFFYNKKLRRCLFFTCCARNKSSYCYDDSDAMSDADSDYDTTYSNPKNADVHMAPRNYYDSDEDMYFDEL